MRKKAWFNPVLFLLAQSLQGELARQVQYLKAENQILRKRLPKYIHVTPAEKTKLLKFGQPLGRAIQALVSIVTPRTFARWASDEKKRGTGDVLSLPASVVGRGRPRTSTDIRELVIRISKETGWGNTRIMGEIKKLGIEISIGTVRNILREEGLCPTPRPGEKSWSQFVQMHAQSLWACDFFEKKVWSGLKRKTCCVLFFIHIGTRRVHLAGASLHPDAAWMAQRAAEFREVVAKQGSPEPVTLFRDRDSKFTREFDAVLEQGDIKVAKLTPKSPNLNPYAEVWVGSIRRECLNDFICFGEKHLSYVVEQYVDFYNSVRPHQGIGNVPIGLVRATSNGPPPEKKQINCQQWLGGLLRHYYLAAA